MKSLNWWRRRDRKRADEVPEHVPPPKNFEVRVSGLSHVHAILDPSTTIGPEPLNIPLTGYNVYVDLVASGDQDVVLHRLYAEVIRRRPMKPSGVSIAPRPGQQGISYSEEQSEARRRALENYQPMRVPDAEVFLDETPPLVRPALDEKGIPVAPDFRLPLRTAAGSGLRIVLAPHTEDRGRVDWRLFADVTCGDYGATKRWDLMVTAATTMRTFHPGRTEPEFTPVHVIAPHWRVAWPPTGSGSGSG